MANQETQEKRPLQTNEVALMIWSEFAAQPFRTLVTKECWEELKEQVRKAGGFKSEDVYNFVSPTDSNGIKMVLHLSKVVGWAATINTGIVPFKAIKREARND